MFDIFQDIIRKGRTDALTVGEMIYLATISIILGFAAALTVILIAGLATASPAAAADAASLERYIDENGGRGYLGTQDGILRAPRGGVSEPTDNGWRSRSADETRRIVDWNDAADRVCSEIYGQGGNIGSQAKLNCERQISKH
jgi:hypothetical protein